MPINNITQTISTLPPAGRRGVDVQTVFVIKQEDFQDHLQGTTVAELNTLKDQLNSRIGEINSTATTMNGYADTASTGASTATTKAGEASTSAGNALAYQNQAETFKNNASTSATKAGQWADNNYNVEVETGKYSAKHWATVAQSASREDIKGSAIVSATTTTIGTAGLGDYIHITGTATITSFGTAANAGVKRTLIFDAALTITNGANLICVGGVNIITVANTIVSVVAETTTQWRIEYVIHPSISFAELGYLDGVTSSIQTQINSKISALDVNTSTLVLKTIATGTATFNSVTNNINLTGIGIGVEIGDVIQLSGADDAKNNSEFTIEVIIDNNNIIVNQAHANKGTNKNVANRSGDTGVTVKLLAKWYNAPIGLGQGWVDVTVSRSAGVTYPNNTNRTIDSSIWFDSLVAVAQATLLINGVGIENIAFASGTEGSLGKQIPKSSNYSVTIITGFTIFKWSELR